MAEEFHESSSWIDLVNLAAVVSTARPGPILCMQSIQPTWRTTYEYLCHAATRHTTLSQKSERLLNGRSVDAG